MSKFFVYITGSGATENEDRCLAVVQDKKQLEQVLNAPENRHINYYILNQKGESVDKDLNVIIAPNTSMDSMVGLLQSKFHRGKK